MDAAGQVDGAGSYLGYSDVDGGSGGQNVRGGGAVQTEPIIIDGCLEVHRDGRIFEVEEDGKRIEKWLCLSGPRKCQGTVSVYRNKKQVHYSAKRLVAKAFVPNPENKPYVSNKDGNPLNIHADNLEWTSPSERADKVKRSKEKTCSVCGKIHCAKDEVCTKCRQARKRFQEAQAEKELRESIQLKQIRKELGEIDTDTLSETEKEIICMRLRGFTVQEIADKQGCTKQNISLHIKRMVAREEKKIIGMERAVQRKGGMV